MSNAFSNCRSSFVSQLSFGPAWLKTPVCFFHQSSVCPAFFGRWFMSPGSRRRPIDPLRSVATRPIVHVDPYSAGRIFFPASFSLTTCIHDSAKYPLPCAEHDCRRQQSLHDSSSTLNKNIGSLGRNATYNGLLYLGDTSTLRNVIDFRS